MDFEGVHLSFNKLFEPSYLHFLQFRLVANATLASSIHDPTPFTTYYMKPASADSRRLLIPASDLQQGRTYQFQLGYPFPGYTYFSPVAVATTFDNASSLISNIRIVPNTRAFTISWDPPRYTVGLVSYQIRVNHFGEGAGGLAQPIVDYSRQRLVQSLDVSSTLGVVVGCLTGSIGCLASDTLHRIEIFVLRESKTETPSTFLIATAFAFVPIVPGTIASIFVHAGNLGFTPIYRIPVYKVGTSLDQTAFQISFVSADSLFSLTVSSAIVLGSTEFSISLQLGQNETDTLSNYAAESYVPFSPLTLLVNGSAVVNLTIACLSSISSVSAMLTAFRSPECLSSMRLRELLAG